MKNRGELLFDCGVKFWYPDNLPHRHIAPTFPAISPQSQNNKFEVGKEWFLPSIASQRTTSYSLPGFDASCLLRVSLKYVSAKLTCFLK